MDFTTLDCGKDGKENILVMMDAFSNLTVAVRTPNQQAKSVAKDLVDRWFYTYGIASRIHSDRANHSIITYIHHLYTIYGVKQSTTTLYNPHGNPNCESCN